MFPTLQKSEVVPVITVRPELAVPSEVRVIPVVMPVEAAEVKHRRAVHRERRIEAPAERIIEYAIRWNERKLLEPRVPRVPIPACAKPARPIPTVHHIGLCRSSAGFGEVKGPQAAPPI